MKNLRWTKKATCLQGLEVVLEELKTIRYQITIIHLTASNNSMKEIRDKWKIIIIINSNRVTRMITKMNMIRS